MFFDLMMRSMGTGGFLDCEITDDCLRGASRLVGVGSHDPAFLLARWARALSIRSLI